MSFMNPVDMVEEDAADLQFPKARPVTKKKCKKKVIKALVTPDTKYLVASYNPQQFNHRLEQQIEHTTTAEDFKQLCSHDHQCACCHLALQEPYVKCADCSAELCLQCFATGRETIKHYNNHAYIIIKDDIQIFPGPGKWTARDERILLNSLQTQGYGNWEAVSKALQYRYSVAECRQHYHDNYFGGIFERLLGLQHASQTYMPENMPYVVKMRSVDPPRHDDISSMQFKMMAGYRSARGDFDTPYDVTAESILTTILESEDTVRNIPAIEGAVDENTSACVEELKLALVRSYNHRLRERQRRYKIMRDHGLIMANRCLGWITKYADALRSEQNCKRFLAFMQLCEPIQFDLLMEGLKYFSDLQKTIFRLYELRQNGVRTMIGGSLYFKLKKKRLHEQREKVKNERLRAQYDWRKLIPNANTTLEALGGTYFIAPTTNALPRKKAAPMDVFGLPGFAKLSEDERKLCSVARIVPQAYLDYKNILVAENAKVGHLRLADARRLIKIDVNKTRQIYDFLIEHGHINKPN
ncbi:transcriptional adapter 2A isoform X2 [Lucilia sericata]|uniref:transcriptional adapter 2A isoform X2 n=1 Tax=Lucilia sericata TaxID=13632 RepID=UPI0018A84234|nr:transcriptional adapter 2A isoform X2 [Lucilia sericata]